MSIDNLTKEKFNIYCNPWPTLGINQGMNPDEILVASYLDPGFWIYRFTETLNRKGKLEFMLEHIGSMSDEVSVQTRKGKYINLWPDDMVRMPEVHSQRRAQVAQIEGNKMYYLQNAGREIGVLDLKTYDMKFLGNTEESCEYFRLMPDGSIVTIENFLDCKLGLYDIDGSNLRQVERRGLNDFSAMSSAMKRKDDVVRFIYGLAEKDNELLLISDYRSNLDKGIYAIDISDMARKGLRSSLFEGDNMRFVEASRGLYGNGILPCKYGIIISQHLSEISIKKQKVCKIINCNGTSKLVYVPETQYL